jgi:hypothetical protein
VLYVYLALSILIFQQSSDAPIQRARATMSGLIRHSRRCSRCLSHITRPGEPSTPPQHSPIPPVLMRSHRATVLVAPTQHLPSPRQYASTARRTISTSPPRRAAKTASETGPSKKRNIDMESFPPERIRRVPTPFSSPHPNISLRRVHSFTSRARTFSDDAVETSPSSRTSTTANRPSPTVSSK